MISYVSCRINELFVYNGLKSFDFWLLLRFAWKTTLPPSQKNLSHSRFSGTEIYLRKVTEKDLPPIFCTRQAGWLDCQSNERSAGQSTRIKTADLCFQTNEIKPIRSHSNLYLFAAAIVPISILISISIAEAVLRPCRAAIVIVLVCCRRWYLLVAKWTSSSLKVSRRSSWLRERTMVSPRDVIMDWVMQKQPLRLIVLLQFVVEYTD